MSTASMLVVEDDAILRRELIQQVSSDWDVTEVADGVAAIKVLWDGSFDAIVLDLMLPNLTGYDVVRHLSMRRPELLARTIIVTAATDVSFAFIDPQTVFAILKKPLDPNQLREALGRMTAAGA